MAVPGAMGEQEDTTGIEYLFAVLTGDREAPTTGFIHSQSSFSAGQLAQLVQLLGETRADVSGIRFKGCRCCSYS